MIRDASLCLELPAVRRPGFRAWLTTALIWLRERYVVYRQRRALLALDAAMLKDIGISRADAVAEGSKPFWRS
ncbi:MAG: DUF1127 domain-containing protein [Candidatus Competibacter sp.]|nr:DUF1127 domain-containing protein [Candidatus Competibacter sp.]MDG4607190.1 DUF1127 domain-containing protein [Candidatus Contendobacter sp.]HRD50029.1 DUF1127 domain-containing protein [Candidatus Contendobacter sp.]